MQGMGVVEGGWEFVWAAYGISAAILVGHAVSVHVRYRAECARRRREEAPGGTRRLREEAPPAPEVR
jgi:heme exporter protein CcmD